MDLAFTADPLPLQSSAHWARLLASAETVGKSVVSKQRLTKVERRIYALAEELGSKVLDSHDLADLHARLHAAARSKRLLQLEVAALREFGSMPLPAAAEVEQVFTHTLGDSRLVRECAHLLAVRLDIIGRFLAQEEVDFEDEVVEDPTRFLADFRTPPIIRSLFQETLAGEVALLALLAPLVDAGRWACAPWIRRALLEQIRASSIAHLRLLSLVPGAAIPDDVLPSEERLDLGQLEAESAQLARYVINPTTKVDIKYAGTVLDEVFGDSPTPPGVFALFAD